MCRGHIGNLREAARHEEQALAYGQREISQFCNHIHLTLVNNWIKIGSTFILTLCRMSPSSAANLVSELNKEPTEPSGWDTGFHPHRTVRWHIGRLSHCI